jgi:hypothetical protein
MGLPQPLADAFRDFERAESADQTGQAPRLEDVRAIEKNLAKLSEGSRTLFQGMERRVAAGELPEDLDETIGSLLETEEEFRREFPGSLRVLRDLRWNLMALRAEMEPPGNAPVFDNPWDLLEYLKTNSQ